MPKITKQIYWDSCVFLAYLNNEPGRAEVIEAIWGEISTSDDTRILTASISIVEVGHLTIEKEKHKLLPDTTAKIDKMWTDPSVLIVEVNSPIMYIARNLMRTATSHGWSLKPYDATHLATAIWINTNVPTSIKEFYTYDDKLPKLTDLAGFPILEPPNLERQLSF